MVASTYDENTGTGGGGLTSAQQSQLNNAATQTSVNQLSAQLADQVANSVTQASVDSIVAQKADKLELDKLATKKIVRQFNGGETAPSGTIVRVGDTLFLNDTGGDIQTTAITSAALQAAGFVNYSIDKPISLNIADYGFDFVDGRTAGSQAKFDAVIYAVDAFQQSAKQSLRDDSRPLVKMVSPSGQMVLTEAINLGTASHDFSNLTIFPTGSWSEDNQGRALVTCEGSTRGAYQSDLWFYQNHDITRTDESNRVAEGEVVCVSYNDLNSALGVCNVRGSYFHTLCEAKGNTEKLEINIIAEDGYKVFQEHDDGDSPDQNKVSIKASRYMVAHHQVSPNGQFQISGDYHYALGDAINPRTTRTDPLDPATTFHEEIASIFLQTKKTARLSGVIRQNNNHAGTIHCYTANGRGDYVFNDLLLMGNSGSAANGEADPTTVPEVVIERCSSVSGTLNIVDSRSQGTGVILGDVDNSDSLNIHMNNNRHAKSLVIGHSSGNPTAGRTVTYNDKPTNPTNTEVSLENSLSDFSIITNSGVSKINSSGSTGCKVIGGESAPEDTAGLIQWTSNDGLSSATSSVPETPVGAPSEGYSEASDTELNMPITRTNALITPPSDITQLFGSGDFPRIVKQERTTANFSGTVAGANGLLKYRQRLVKETDRSVAEALQSSGTMAQGIYFVNNSIVSTYNSPFANNGNASASKYSHGLFFSGLGRITDSGSLDPAYVETATSHKVYPGHFLPTSNITVTTTSPAALPNNNTGTRVFTITEDVSDYRLNRSYAIWTPSSVGATVSDEWADANGFEDCELMVLSSISGQDLTFTRLFFPSGDHFTTLAAGGVSVQHPVGSHIMPVASSQGTNKRLNFEMNITRFCPDDDAGNTFVEMMVDWVADNLGWDSNGNAVNVNYSFIQNDVSETYPNSEDEGDVDGNSPIGSSASTDNGIVGNINEYQLGMKNIRDAFQARPETAGLPYVSGGTNEHFYRGWQAAQIEHIGSDTGGQETTSEVQEFDDLIAQIHRTRLFTEKYSSVPALCAVVAKESTLAFPDGTGSQTNDSIHLKFAVSNLAKAAFATRNFSATVDDWWHFGAVDVNGEGISNTADQSQILANLGWLGQPLGSVKNISGIDFSTITPFATLDYQAPGTTSRLGSGAGGNNRGAMTVNYSSANGGQLLAEGYPASSRYSGARVDTAEVCGAGDVGKTLVLNLRMRSNCRGVVAVQVGQSNVAFKKVYLDDVDETLITVTKVLTSNDVSSAFNRRCRIELGRNNEHTTATPTFSLLSLVSYCEDLDIDPNLFVQEFDNGAAFVNATDFSKTISIPTGFEYRAIDSSNFTPNQQASFVTDGQVFDENNALTLPPRSGITLFKSAGGSSEGFADHPVSFSADGNQAFITWPDGSTQLIANKN